MFGFFAEEAGLLGQPLVRGLGFVVGAGVASGLGAAPPVGLPRGQEQVLAQVHIPPQLVEQRQLIGGVVAVAEGGLAHDVAVLLLHVRVVVGGVRPRAGHEDHPLGAPGDQGVVDELSAVVTVQPDHRVRQPVSDLRDGRNDPGVGAVADGDVHGPPEVDVGSGQRPGVLTLEGVPAVSDQVDLEEPWGLLHLVHRLTYHDRPDAQTHQGRPVPRGEVRDPSRGHVAFIDRGTSVDGQDGEAPGFFEIDLVAHCGHTLKGEHAWTLTATDVYLGWTVNIAIRNRAHARVVAAIAQVADRLPYPMVGLDCDNGGEFINHALIAWCAERMIFMTRARAHTSNDNAHVEQKNGDIVRKSAFRYRYDTPDELALLNELWGYVNLRKNLFLPTRKANGWRSTKAGRNTRTYDEPKTPYQRLTEEAGFLGEETEHRLQELYAQTNPADLTRNINRIQQALIVK